MTDAATRLDGRGSDAPAPGPIHNNGQCSRFWLTAKGWRALGLDLPSDIADDEVVVP